MHDAHCHLDLYSDPYSVAVAAEQQQIATVAVTNLPSAYYAAKPHMRSFKHLKLAVGLHPLLAENHTEEEKRLFVEALSETSYVGEIGLDFSKQGLRTKERQVGSLEFVLTFLQRERKLVTVHSRRAEIVVLRLLEAFDVHPVIFHWYSGTLSTLREIIGAGHYVSVNTAMIRSENGQRIAEHIPRDRMLTETDGPFVRAGGRSVLPRDAALVTRYLAQRWDMPRDVVANQLDGNFSRYISETVLE
jgi:TatD DNase family protein